MSNHEEINAAFEYWSRNISSCCEAGSVRDFLAINDLKLFMDEIKRLRDEVDNLKFLIKEASEGL